MTTRQQRICKLLVFVLVMCTAYYSIMTPRIPLRVKVGLSSLVPSLAKYTQQTNTRYYFKHSGQSVNVGSYFSVIIEASVNSHSLKGGDFWYATIRNNIVNEAGKITDFDNGTYEATFFAAQSGEYDIEIILVHPSKTVDFIENVLWPMEDRVVWNGNFTSNDKKQYELTKCGLRLQDEYNNKCVYNFSLAMGKTVFLCDKPKKKMLTCDSLTSLQSKTNEIERTFSNLFAENAALFHKSVTYFRIWNGPKKINVINTETSGNMTYNLVIPECKADLPATLSDGFWVDDTWTSLRCKSKQWTMAEIKQCVKGKQLYFFGDSTTRQWNAGLLDLLGLSKSNKTKNLNGKRTYHSSDVVNLTFTFHPYTIGRNPMRYRIGKWEYEILDNLDFSTCNYIIMISPWAHYTQWVKERYIERLYLLRQTILRLRKRCPNTILVVKTPKPRNHDTRTSLLYTGDRLIYDIPSLFLDIFKDFGIHIIDVWDMNLAYPSPNTIHMPMQVIYQELYLFLSHVCKVK